MGSNYIFFDDCLVKGISNCEQGYFIVTLEEKLEDGSGSGKQRKFLMNSAGMIRPFGYEKLESKNFVCFGVYEPRGDGFFVSKNDSNNILVDGKGNIVLEGFEKVSPFAENGICTAKFGERSFWIDKNGDFYGTEEDVLDVGNFNNGFSWKKLKGEKPFQIVNENFEEVGGRFEYVVIDSNNFIVKEGETYKVLNRNFEEISTFDFFPYLTDYGVVVNIKSFVSDEDINEIYDLKGNHLFNCSKFCFNPGEKVVKFINNKKTFYLNQETGEILGFPDGFNRGDDFKGDMTAVEVGLNKDGDPIYTFLKSSGKLFKNTHSIAYMIDKNVGVFSDENDTLHVHVVDIDENEIIRDAISNFYVVNSFKDEMAVYGMLKYTKKDRNLKESKSKNKDDNVPKCKFSAVNQDFVSLPEYFDSMQDFSSGFSVVTKDGKFGLVTKDGTNFDKIVKKAKALVENPEAYYGLSEKFLNNEFVIRDLCEAAIYGAELTSVNENVFKLRKNHLLAMLEKYQSEFHNPKTKD